MTKTHADRVIFYLRKTIEFTSIPIQHKKPGSLRFKRLMAYNDAVSKRIKEEATYE